METSRATPPADALILFSGQHMGCWQRRDGQGPGWKVESGLLEVIPGAGDILTCEQFADFYLHLEFRCPYQPKAKGQARGNSGVYLQGRYEIQILDSYNVTAPGDRDCGAIYQLAAPLVNATRPPAVWQSFEVIFRARAGDEPARVTVLQNGRVIHNNLALPRPTPGSLDDELEQPGPILLQEHGDPVAFRRIWAVPLSRR